MASPASLSDLAQTYLRAKAAADSTDLGRNIRDAQNYLKADFHQSCRDNKGWNKSYAQMEITGSALKKMGEWAQRWGVSSDQPMLAYTSPLVSTAVQYNNICGKKGEWNETDVALVSAAEKARAVFKAAVFSAFQSIGLDGVKKALSDEITHYPRLERAIDNWYARYKQQ